ncbi:MAG: DUF6443 domain-containing protein, partial [Bacteroidota bacterium]
MKIYKVLFVIAALFSLGSSLMAQPLNTKVDAYASPTPEAAALGQYTDIPVDLFSGTPSISVPICQLSQGALAVPISVSYHASGIQVRQQASWVGLGWSLNAGGRISRTVRGFADEDADGFFSNNQIHPNSTNGNQIISGQIDGESDIYSFNVGGYSGKFVYDNSGNILLIERQDLKIVPRTNNGFEGFEITTPDGTRYIFGGVNAEEKSKTYSWSQTPSPTNNYEYVSSWLLTEIASFDDRDHLYFEYGEQERYSVWDLALCEKGYWYCENDPVVYDNTACYGYYHAATDKFYNITEINGRRLTRIYSGREEVLFEADVNNRQDIDPFFLNPSLTVLPKALKTIRKQTLDGKFCEQHEFFQSYFTNPNPLINSSGKRLKLDSIARTACDGSEVIPAYTFEYYGPTNPDGTAFIFDRFSLDADHWGYFNDASNTPMADYMDIPFSTLTCDGKVNQEGGGDLNANPDVNVQNIATLKKIRYPTGGGSTFAFESHSYKDLWISNPRHDLIRGLVNCNQDPNQGYCCNNAHTAEATLILTQEQIDEAKFSWSHFIPPGSCNNNNMSYLRIFQNSVQVGVVSYNVDPVNPNQVINMDLSDVPHTIVAGVETTFRITTEFGNASFDLWWEDNQVNTEKYAGGLRIKSITNDPADGGPTIVRTYEYTKNNNPSGVLFFKSDYGYCYEYYGPNSSLFYPLVYHQFTKPIVLPLTNHEARYIGYEAVTEHTAHHSVTHEFEIPFDQNTLQLTTGTHRADYDSPFNDAPRFLPAWIGQLVRKDMGNGDEEVTTYEKQEVLVPNSYNSGRIKSFLSCSLQAPPEFYNYSFKQSWSLVKSNRVVVDGLENLTEYSYDLNKHLQPIEVKTSNSDGKMHSTFYKYPHFYASSPVYQTMVDQNRLLPVETTSLVDGVELDGSRTTFRYMDASGSQPSGLTSGFGPYPYLFERYEYSWDALGVGSGSWQSVATIEKYDPVVRKPAEFRQQNWDKYELSWDPSSLRLLSKKYKNHEQFYQYEGQSGLVSKTIAIDDQEVDYFYGQLRRLRRVESRDRKVVDSISYGYRGQSSGDNYIRQQRRYEPVAGSDLSVVATRQYVDGLGRNVQLVKEQYAPDGKDVVVDAVAYDGNSRVVRQYIPLHSTYSDGRRVNIPANHKHTAIAYESRPYNRVVSTRPPSWYATTTSYGVNGVGEVFNLLTQSPYAPGLLAKTTVIDPNGNQSITYTDKLGRKLMDQRRPNAGGSASTYYRYDDKGRVDMILPPDVYVSHVERQYRYVYDGADNILEKKIPGQEPIKMRYNNRDLLTFSQDGEQKLDGVWLHNKYDVYGRPYQSGFWQGSDPNGNSSLPLSEELTYTFYDGPQPIQQGKMRLQRHKILGTSNDYLSRYFYYDSYGRNNQSLHNSIVNASPNSGHTILDFDNGDNVINNNWRHKSASNVLTTINNRFSYDDQGRLIDVHHQIDGGPEVNLANHQYNHRDFLVQKNLHQSGNGYLQNVDYGYNDQGWLQTINEFCQPDPNLPGGGGGIGLSDLQLQLEYDPAQMESSQTAFAVTLSGQLTNVEGTKTQKTKEQLVNVRDLQGQATYQFAAVESPKSYAEKLTLDYAEQNIGPEQLGAFLLEMEQTIHEKIPSEQLAGVMASAAQRLIEEQLPLVYTAPSGGKAGIQGTLPGGTTAPRASIPTPGGSTSPDLFAMRLRYDSGEPNVSSTAQYNGNIASMAWQIGCQNIQYYGYNYDYQDRMTVANYAESSFQSGNLVNVNHYNVSAILYDKRGNLERLYRRGERSSGYYGYIDRLQYRYTESHLTSMIENSLFSYQINGFQSTIGGGTGQYTYDANGNMTSDEHRGISNIAYNHLNLPERIDYSNGNWIEWTYDAAGTKLKKQTSAGTTKYYVDGIEYAGSTLEAIYHSEGRAVPDNGSYRYEYCLKDHLGNSRLTFSDLDGSGTVDTSEILQESHYYPFGMQMEGSWSSVRPNKYGYNGKELNE